MHTLGQDFSSEDLFFKSEHFWYPLNQIVILMINLRLSVFSGMPLLLTFGASPPLKPLCQEGELVLKSLQRLGLLPQEPLQWRVTGCAVDAQVGLFRQPVLLLLAVESPHQQTARVPQRQNRQMHPFPLPPILTTH